MSHQYGNDMFSEMPQRSSAGINGNTNGLYSNNTIGGGGGGLNRQSSRQFEQHSRPQYQTSLYGDEDRLPTNYETRTLDSRASSQQSYGQQFNGSFDPPNLWSTNSNSSPPYTANTLGANSRIRSAQSNRRGALPSQWGAPEPQSMQQQYSMPPPPQPHMNSGGYANGMSQGMQSGMPNGIPGGMMHNGINRNGGGQMPMGMPLQGQQYSPSLDMDDDNEELIPTAIVIKNIPFAVKREELSLMMNEMNLPTPYAFNYHFDNGIFRGLAFANYSTSQETALVIEKMNHLDLNGRKLRVEYKKMLPQQERERIEREKRLRRGQLEEQHRPMTEAPRSLNMQASYASLSNPHPGHSQSPSPISLRAHSGMPSNMDGGSHKAYAVDMNQPIALETLVKIVSFKAEGTEALSFPAPLSSNDRQVIHEIAQKQGLYHYTTGSDQTGKGVTVTKSDPSKLMMDPGQFSNNGVNSSMDRRGLSRAATTDFTDGRDAAQHLLRQQTSAFLHPQGYDGSFAGQNLRAAKSFGDLHVRFPSPANSDKFTTDLATNAMTHRYLSSAYANNNSSTASLTQRAGRDDLSSAFGSLSVSNTLSNANLSRLDRTGPPGPSAGAIGSHRTANGANDNLEEQSLQQQRLARATREPRVPNHEAPAGFRSRQRGSRDLDNGSQESADSLDSPVGNPYVSRFAGSRN